MPHLGVRGETKPHTRFPCCRFSCKLPRASRSRMDFQSQYASPGSQRRNAVSHKVPLLSDVFQNAQKHPGAAWTFNISHAYSGVRGETKLPTRLSCFRISFKTPKNIQGPHGLLIQTNLTWESEAKRSFAQGSFASFSFKKRKRACPAPASGGGRSPRGPGCGRSLRLRRG